MKLLFKVGKTLIFRTKFGNEIPTRVAIELAVTLCYVNYENRPFWHRWGSQKSDLMFRIIHFSKRLNVVSSIFLYIHSFCDT